MSYLVTFNNHAARSFRKLSRDIQQRLKPVINDLQEDPRPIGAEKIKGQDDIYRIRVGDYRILYEVRDKELVICIVETGHRREVYRR
jgi:mRNA interferase RelE/StbE